MSQPSGRRTEGRLRVGLDVGGTKIDAIALSSDGAVIGRRRRATARGADALVESICLTVADLAEHVGFAHTEVGSVGIGVPGLVDPVTGLVRHAVNLEVQSLDLAGRVAERIGVPVRVENDVKAAALGAATLTDTTGCVAYLNLGTGVAAGIVIDGVIWHGAGGAAGEVGHLSVDPRGRLCECGQRGCIETMSGGGALGRAWGSDGAHPVRELLTAAAAGDLRAQELRSDLFRGAAAAVRALALTIAANRVVIGGGLVALGDELRDGVRDALRTESRSSSFLRSLHLDERVELLPADSPAAAFGAALVGERPFVKETATHG